MQQDYTYAVARVRYRETQLLTDTDLAQLLTANSTEAVIRSLRDKGWGGAADQTPEDLLRTEDDKTWRFISEIVPDRSVLNFFLIPNDFHNLKVVVKAVTRDVAPDHMLIRHCTTDPDALYRAVKQRRYSDLPNFLQDVAQEAMTTLLQTSDGQLCDIIADKACLEYMNEVGVTNENEIVQLYCTLFVASSNIKIAVRCAKTGKKIDFIRRALSSCPTLDTDKLAEAASLGYDDIMNYLDRTDYRSAVPALSRSMSAFEKWCDDAMTEHMKSQKLEPFGIGPIVAYMIARFNEVKAVRMILSAKSNGQSDDVIKERLWLMYA